MVWLYLQFTRKYKESQNNLKNMHALDYHTWIKFSRGKAWDTGRIDLLSEHSWRILMSELTFLVALEVPSPRREYKAPIREVFFTKTSTTSPLQFVHIASNNDTECSLPILEILEEVEHKIPMTTSTALARKIALDPLGISAKAASTAKESTIRSSLISIELRRQIRIGISLVSSTLQWLLGSNRRLKRQTKAFFLPCSSPIRTNSTKEGIASRLFPINPRYSSTEER